PLFRRPVTQAVAVSCSERLADWNEVPAGVQPLGDLLDPLAKSLAIAKVRGDGETIDLGAAIVDVVFAGHRVAGCGQEVRQRIAEDSPAAMSDMQGARRVCRDVLDIDLFAAAESAAAISVAERDDRAKDVQPVGGPEPQVDEAGPGDLRRVNVGVARQRRGNPGSQLTRPQAERFGQKHRPVGGEVPMVRLPRRLHHDPIEAGESLRAALPDDGFGSTLNPTCEVAEYVHASDQISVASDQIRRNCRSVAPLPDHWQLITDP